jgi:soluble lytic murein transglycosylase
VRQAIDLVTGYSIPMARSESLMVARRAVDVGRPADADRYLRALARGGRLDEGAMLAWGDAESALGKWDAAARSYRTIRSGALAGRAAYLAARADLRGGNGNPTAALATIPSRFPGDGYAAGNALYLLGDLALDANLPDSARALFRRLADLYPQNEFAERAALVAPLIAYARGQHQLAARELDAAVASGVLAGFAADAGRYWAARATEGAGDRDGAASRYAALLERGPENYYALRAAARMGVAPWRFGASRVDSSATPPALQRAAWLEAIGLDAEARLELDAAAAEATTPTAMLELAAALLRADHPARASRLALRAIQAGAPRDGLTLRLLYPLPYAASLTSTARAAGLDPWLAAAVIRQESGFDPRAVSAVGARGLMQVMPANGPSLARAIGLDDWDPALLFVPDVNLAMGTRHLAEGLERHPELERALAAYNAGGSRVERWNRTLLDGGTADSTFDVELYVERIPYLETRGYVRNILVNREMYRLLYEVD